MLGKKKESQNSVWFNNLVKILQPGIDRRGIESEICLPGNLCCFQSLLPAALPCLCMQREGDCLAK